MKHALQHMSLATKKIIHWPFHILLLPLFPTLSFASSNFDELLLNEVVYKATYILIVVLVISVMMRVFFLKNIHKVAALISVGFFIFRPLSRLNTTIMSSGAHKSLEENVIILLLLLFFFIGIVVVKKVPWKFNTITAVFNIFALCFVVIPLSNIGYLHVQRVVNPVKLTSPLPSGINSGKNLQSGSELPDIYYIIVDRYANASTLADYFNFDNSEFLTFLTDKGFYIASQSAANYPFTPTSMASSLNMTYLDEVIAQVDKISMDKIPLYTMIENNAIIEYLKKRGYTYYHLSSDWEATDQNKHADVHHLFKKLSNTEVDALFDDVRKDQKNVLGRFIYDNFGNLTRKLLQEDITHGGALLSQMLAFSQVPKEKGPKFVFAHSLLTHDPYVFDKHGNYTLALTWNEPDGAKPKYIEQLQFSNTLLSKLIETILATSKTPPIIILQSDEGPYPKRFREEGFWFDWRGATRDELREKMRIINYFYFPDLRYDMLYPEISPVNTFRVIFNKYFHENLPLLPDTHYAQVYYEVPYDVFNVDDLIK